MANTSYEYLVEYLTNSNAYDGKEMRVFRALYAYIMSRMDGLGICTICLRWIPLHISRPVSPNFNLVLAKQTTYHGWPLTMMGTL